MKKLKLKLNIMKTLGDLEQAIHSEALRLLDEEPAKGAAYLDARRFIAKWSKQLWTKWQNED